MSRVASILRRPTLFVALFAASVCVGCASVEDPKATRDESFTEATGYQRKNESTTLPFSVSDRGRDIEKDLGVRTGK